MALDLPLDAARNTAGAALIAMRDGLKLDFGFELVLEKGLPLGSGMGGDPVGLLTGTWIGVTCLAAGCALACLGITWVERIAAAAERTA